MQELTTPVILALTRRATVCGLPYNTFITWLLAACVTVIWVDSMLLLALILLGSYLGCSYLCQRDVWALDIFFARMSKIGACQSEVKHYLHLRSYGAQ